MSEFDKTLRERLLDMETPNATQKESLEKQVRAILEGRLSVATRLGLGLLAGIGILFVLDFVHVRGWLPSSQDMSRNVTGSFWLLGFISALAWTALTAYSAIRGRLGSRVRASLIAGLGAAMIFVYLIIRTFGIQFALLRADPERYRVNWDEQFTIAVFFLLVFAGLYLILRVVYRMESKTQEKLLEIEYRLADLAEKIEGGRKQ